MINVQRALNLHQQLCLQSYPSIHPPIQAHVFHFLYRTLCVATVFPRGQPPHTNRGGYEDLMAQARRLCIQWDITGAITLVASDAVWNAVPGNITNLASVLPRGEAPQYRARSDFDPPTALDPTATAVELANWKQAGNGYAFCIIYTTGPKHAYISVVGQCGTGKHDSFKSRVYPSSPLPHPPPDCWLHVYQARVVNWARLEEAQSSALWTSSSRGRAWGAHGQIRPRVPQALGYGPRRGQLSLLWAVLRVYKGFPPY